MSSALPFTEHTCRFAYFELAIEASGTVPCEEDEIVLLNALIILTEVCLSHLGSLSDFGTEVEHYPVCWPDD